jgi:DNA-binding NtrC family response regulator
MVVNGQQGATDMNEREILYKVLFDMKNDLNDLRSLVGKLLKDRDIEPELIEKIYRSESQERAIQSTTLITTPQVIESPPREELVEVEESLSLEEKEKELIQKALKKHNDKRKYAAAELGISERTLYRKIKEYSI